jgi:hypothetical protein
MEVLPRSASAGSGAEMMLLSADQPILPNIEHVSLAADPGFQDAFMDCIGFPGKERRESRETPPEVY